MQFIRDWTERLNSKTLKAWGKSPVAGKLAIQRLRGSRWLNVKQLTVGKGDVFTTKLQLKGKQQLRASVAGNQSLVWRQANSRKTTTAAASSGSGCSGRGGGWILPLVFALSLAGALALTLMRRRWRFA